MESLTAVATQYGLGVLSSALKDKATKYQLIGATTHDKPENQTFSFYESVIDSSYFDEYGVLTFNVELPVAENFGKYLYAIAILDDTDQIVVKVNTPKIALVTGIGGTVPIKTAVMGQAGEMVFKASNYITEPELEDLWMGAIYANTAATIHNGTEHLKLYKKVKDLEKQLNN